jgi:hypothetical protein
LDSIAASVAIIFLDPTASQIAFESGVLPRDETGSRCAVDEVVRASRQLGSQPEISSKGKFVCNGRPLPSLVAVFRFLSLLTLLENSVMRPLRYFTPVLLVALVWTGSSEAQDSLPRYETTYVIEVQLERWTSGSSFCSCHWRIRSCLFPPRCFPRAILTGVSQPEFARQNRVRVV